MTPDDETWPAPPEAEAFKLGLFALVRLRAYDRSPPPALDARAAGLDLVAGRLRAAAQSAILAPRPRSGSLIGVKGRYTPAFAARGSRRASRTPPPPTSLLPLLDPDHPAARGRRVVIIAIRELGLAPAGARLGALAADAAVDGSLRMEAVTTLGALKAIDQLPIVQDLITDDWPALRAAAIRANAAIDPDNFMLILSGLEIDRHWMGRAALADALATLAAGGRRRPAHRAAERRGQRVIPHVLRALVAAEGARRDGVAARAAERRGLRDARERRRIARRAEAGRRGSPR